MRSHPTTCDQCGLTLVPSGDRRSLDCPQHGEVYRLRPSNPYNAAVIAEAQKHLGNINKALASASQEVRHAMLWMLEDEWLADTGHVVTIKFGNDIYRDLPRCALCRTEIAPTTERVYFSTRDQWLATTTSIALCATHLRDHCLEGELDLCCNQSLRLLGLA